MEHTYIRIGNSGYKKLYGAYGLTTFKDQHVKIEGNDIRFSFKGKKGIHRRITLKSRKLARIVTGEDYTVEDFRIWVGSVHALDCIMNMGCAEIDINIKLSIKNRYVLP